MWFDGERQPNTMYVASVSRGKDSTAMLQAIRLMGWPLDAIVSVDIWATRDIPAELPPMVAFKDEWDRKCLETFGVPVTRLCAKDKDGNKISYNDIFYRKVTPKRERERERDGYYLQKPRGMKAVYGFPAGKGSWCQSEIKQSALQTDSLRNTLTGVQTNSSEAPSKQAQYARRLAQRGGDQLRVPQLRSEMVYGTPQGQCEEEPAPSTYYGFPMRGGNWCTALKRDAIRQGPSQGQSRTDPSAITTWDTPSRQAVGAKASRPSLFSTQPQERGAKINIVHYIGIAADEPERIARHMPCKDKVMPLVQIGWDEALCGLEAQYLDMLAPTYTTSMRDGCWFCHNQGIEQLRQLRHNYPDLWQMLLNWDKDSPVTFHADGHTVHDFDKRFAMEDKGLVPKEKFRWGMLDGSVGVQITIDDIIGR